MPTKKSLLSGASGIRPPLLINFDDYELSSESDVMNDSIDQDAQLNQMAGDLDLSDYREGPKNANLSSIEIKQNRKIGGKVSKKEVKIPQDLLDDD